MSLEDFRIEEEKREEFRQILFELATSQNFLEDNVHRSETYRKLEKLYHNPNDVEKPFRHFYSDIFFVLTQLQFADDDKSMDTLGQNLLEIRKGYRPVNKDCNENKIDISRSIQKLYDHVSLDIARSSYVEATVRKVSGDTPIDDIRLEVRRMNEAVEDTKEKQNEITDKLDSQQRDYIAILGIFAAVVLAFTGGIAFSTSVLENMSGSDVSIYRILITALVIGLVLVNILFGLFYYVDRLVHRHNGEKGRLKPLLVSNLVIVALIAILVIAWCIGAVEARDKRIDTKYLENRPEATEVSPEKATITMS